MKTKSIFVLLAASLTTLMVFWAQIDELFVPKAVIKKPGVASLDLVSKDYETSEKPSVQLTGDLLSLNVHNRPIQSVVKEIAKQAGFTVHFDKHLPDPNIHLTLVNQPLQVGLEHLLQDNDRFYFYSKGNDRRTKLSTLWVYRKGDGELLSPNIPMVGITQSDATIASAKNVYLAEPSCVVEDQKQRPSAKESQTELAVLNQNALKIDETNDVDQLLGFTMNESPEIRAQALAKLASLEVADRGAVDAALETAFSDKDASVRGYALQILSNRLGEDAYDYQRQALLDPNVSVRIAALETVIPSGKGKMLLEEGLLDDNELIRKIAEDRLKQSVKPKKDETG